MEVIVCHNIVKCTNLQDKICDKRKDYKLATIWKICKVDNAKWIPKSGGGFWIWKKPCGLQKVVNMLI